MIEDRAKNASERAQTAEYQQRIARKQSNDKNRQQKSRLKYILGGLILKYFPELSEIAPENTQAELQEQLQDIESLLAFLSDRRDLVQQLQTDANIKFQSAREEDNV